MNVPLAKDGSRKITDDTRIRAAIPTLKLLSEAGARVVVCTHLGKPKKVDDKLRLDPVANRLSELFGKKVYYVPEVTGPVVKKQAGQLKDGDLMLLENVRFNPGETKNKPEFAKSLVESTGATYYVNDAFGTAHRAHASTAGVAKLCKRAAAGMLMEKELAFLYGAIDDPKRPLVVVVGGAKVSTKIPVMKSLIQKANKLLIGGAMMFTFYKAMGKEVGKSLVEPAQMEFTQQLVKDAKAKGVELVLPVDVVCADEMSAKSAHEVCAWDHMPAGKLGLDIGPKTEELFASKLGEAKTIVWNGPMGVFEYAPFAKGTLSIAQTVAKCTENGAISIVGGGDSVSALKKTGLSGKISHVSTGGGASLEVMEGKLLPGVAALNDS